MPWVLQNAFFKHVEMLTPVKYHVHPFLPRFCAGGVRILAPLFRLFPDRSLLPEEDAVPSANPGPPGL